MRIKCLHLVGMALLSANALADEPAYTFTGSIVATKPTYELVNNSTELVSQVKPFQLSASKLSDGEYCTTTTDLTTAMQGGTESSGYCLFEWDTPSNFDTNGYAITGIPVTDGELTLNYKVSFFSGSAKQKVTIDENAFKIPVLAPTLPKLINYTLFIGDEWKGIGRQTNYNPTAGLSKVKLDVEPRKYTQTVTVSNLGSCDVAEGESSCTITFTPIKLGDPATNNEGSLSYALTINSANNYWSSSTAFNSVIDVDWLYMNTDIQDIHYNSMPTGYLKDVSFNLESVAIDVQNNTAKLTVKKPLPTATGDWWKPAQLKLTFNKKIAPKVAPDIIYEQNKLFSKNTSLNSTPKTLDFAGVPEVVGEYLVYEFSLIALQDGQYDVLADMTTLGGMNSKKSLSTVRINKTAPRMEIFKSGLAMQNKSTFYFLRNLVIGTSNGYESDVQVKTLTANGESIALDIHNNGLATINTTSIMQEGENTLKMSVQDSAGNVYTKELNVVYEAVTIPFELKSDNGVLVSYVKESSITAKQLKHTNYCNITTDENTAKGNTYKHSGYCLFEWVGSTELVADKLNLQGMFTTTVGATPIGYKVSTFLGESKDKVILSQGTTVFNVEAPIEPDLLAYSVQADGEWVDNNSKRLNNPKGLISGLKLTIQPLNYTLKVSFQDVGVCLINAGDTSCEVGMPAFTLGDPKSDVDFKGTKTYTYSANSTNNYWTDEALRGDIIIEWIYATAIIEDMAINPLNINGAKTVTMTVNGQEVDVPSDTLKVVLSKPFPDLEGDWWLPKDLAIQFTSTSEHEPMARLVYDQRTLYRSHYNINENSYLLRDFTGSEIINGKYVYSFNVRTVPDGFYNVGVKSVDEYNTEQEKVFEKAAYISRYGAQVGVFRNFGEMEDDSGFYFDTDLIFAAFNGYRDGISITKIIANGQTLPFTQEVTGIAKVSGLVAMLTPNNTVDLEVTAEAFNGEETTKAITVRYAPLQFKLTSSSNERMPFRSVELITLETEQVSGENCTFYSNEESAIKYARNGRVTCMFKWNNLPNSFELSRSTRTPSAYGYLDSDSYTFTNELVIYNEFGETLDIEVKPLTLATQPPKEIMVTPSTRSELIEGMYPVQMTGGELVKLASESSPGSLEFSVTAINTTKTELKHPSSRTGETFQNIVKYDAPIEAGLSLWDVFNVDAKVSYLRYPSMSSSVSVEGVVIPDSSIGLEMDYQDDLILSTDEVTTKVKLGVYNRIDGRVYDASSMGDWDVYIGKYVRKGLPEPLTDTVSLNAQGEALIKMPMDKIGDSSEVLVAVAKARSPIESYSHIVQSAKSYFIVFKGSKIAGDLYNGEIKGSIPLRASISYKAKTIADNAALGEIYWELSSDGINWVKDEESVGSTRYKKAYLAKQIEFIRAKTQNKFTGEWSETETLKIVAFDKADLSIKQVTDALQNEAADFALFDGEKKLVGNEGTYEWSLDNRKTWSNGDVLQSYRKSDISSSNLYARMKYNGVASDSDVGDRSFSEARLRPSYLRAPKFYYTGIVPDLVEVGTTHTLKASVYTRTESLNPRIRGEWVLPDGSVVAGNEASVTFDRNDLDGRFFMVTYKVWIEGSREETMNEFKTRITGWEYTFPNVDLVVPLTVKYSPSHMNVWVALERHSAPGVEYTFELVPTDGLNVLAQDEGKFNLEFAKAGMINVQFKVKNNRGDERIVSQFVEVLMPEPLKVEIVKTVSNDFLRYPLDISLRTRTYLSHPDDKVYEYRWYLDGVLFEQTRKFRSAVSNLDVGRHTVSVEVETAFGQIGTSQFEVTVIPNKKPTGTLSMKEVNAYYELNVQCEDQDGRILAVTWMLNDEELAHGHTVISFAKSKFEGTNTVTAKCYDDSYDYVEMTQLIYGN